MHGMLLSAALLHTSLRFKLILIQRCEIIWEFPQVRVTENGPNGTTLQVPAARKAGISRLETSCVWKSVLPV